jgi:hypothetical protein
MNIPPKNLKQQLAGLGLEPAQRQQQARPAGTAGRQPNDLPASARTPADLAGIESVSADSLPVLKAFQDFLETERKHARRQVAAVTAFFLILFLIVAGAGAFFGYVYFGRMDQQIASLQGELDRAKSSIKKETSEVLSGLLARTDDLSTRIIDGDSIVQKAASEISQTVSNSLSVKLAELEVIRSELRNLEDENRSLRSDLERLASQQLQAASQVTAAASSPMMPPSGTATPSRFPPPEPPETGNPLDPLEMAILAPGSTKTMKWRIPISE